MNTIWLGLQFSATKTLLASADGACRIRLCALLPPMALSLRQNFLELLPSSIQRLIAVSPEWSEELRLPISGICCGMSGLHTKLHEIRVKQALGRLHLQLRTEPLIVEDIHTEFAVSGETRGVSVMISTGFNVLVKGPTPTDPFTLGGWGSELSDRGSGYFIGRRALGALLDFHDNRRSVSSQLVQSIQNAVSIPGPSQASEWYDTLRSTPTWRASVAELAKIVVELAEQHHDISAAMIMEEAASEVRQSLLAALIRSHERSILNIHDPYVIHVCGGLALNSRILQNAIRQAAFSVPFLTTGHERGASLFPRPILELSAHEPIIGALALALHQSSTEFSLKDITTQLKASSDYDTILVKPSLVNAFNDNQ